MERPKRIGVYGGTFDPVHIGHITVAQTLLTVFGLDEVLFVPANNAPHKRGATVTPALHRYAMLALATLQDSALRISTVELDSPEKPYTVDTLAHFRLSLGDAAKIFFVMGADSWSEITSWRDWEKLFDISNQIIVTRPGFSWSSAHVTASHRNKIIDVRGVSNEEVQKTITKDAGHRIYVTDAIFMEVSATEIRRRILNGVLEGWTSLVPSPVAEYVIKYGLYRKEYERNSFNQGAGNAT